METKLRWRYPAGNEALQTPAGKRIGDRIRARALTGCVLSGPRVDMPAGRGVARIEIAGEGRGSARLDVVANGGRRVIASRTINLRKGASPALELAFDLPAPVEDLEVRLHGRLGLWLDIVALEIDLARPPIQEPLRPDRPVGYESRKTYADKIASGFFDRYLSGANVMEIGYKGYDGGTVMIVPQAIGVDVGYPGYDGRTFPFADESFDGIYSSHCFEHIGPWKEVLRDWYRILKPGGFLVIVVPHQFLFERKRELPSTFNPDHKRYYTARSLLAEIEEAFDENSYRIRHLVENDKDFDYRPAPGEGSSGCYEIELVVEKIRKPYWNLEEGSVRTYPAGEFRTELPTSGPWTIMLDCTQPHRCLLWGPYIALGTARYRAEFHLEPMAIDDSSPVPDFVLDVGRYGDRVASCTLQGEAARAMLRSGMASVTFENDDPAAFFEFRIYVGAKPSPLRPAFRGVVLAYDR